MHPHRRPLHPFSLFLALVALAVAAPAQQDTSPAALVDAYLDQRCEAPAGATEALLAALAERGIDTAAAIEALLRAPRHEYPDAGDLVGRTTVHDVECYHVDYASRFRMFVPQSYDPAKPTPLVLVAHGGNSSMTPERAARTAASYLQAYRKAMAEELGAIVVAPHTSRGWGHIGNSLALSTVSKVQRMLNVDPDRIHVTGQSMGGHMAFRAALSIGDRFGAVSPQSGGYDFVAKETIGNLDSVPGYVTWGKQEPYGIDVDSRTNAKWAKEHGLDWVFVEKPGGHEIYQDELPAVARFFAEHPRDLYRPRVYLRQGGAMKFVETWKIQGWPEHVVHHETRPLRWNLRHWIEVAPRPEHDQPLAVMAKDLGDNRIEITCDQVRELFVHLHPRLVDFAATVVISVNGTRRFEGKVEPDLRHMLELCREFDDRGRISWARVRIEVPDDRPVPLPGEEAR